MQEFESDPEEEKIDEHFPCANFFLCAFWQKYWSTGRHSLTGKHQITGTPNE